MHFAYYDLKHVEKGRIIEVKLSMAANVRLMDPQNFEEYKNNQKHQYYGGHVTVTPYRLRVPSTGHWFLTIDLGGYTGNLKHSVQILSGALPNAK